MHALKGKHIRTLRQAHEFDQYQFALLLGVSQSTVSGIELGTRNPSKQLLRKIWDYFALTDAEFQILDDFVNTFNK